MSKIILFVGLLCCFCSCVRDNDAIYYPVGNIDIERGNANLSETSEATLIARSANLDDYVLDTLAGYPGDPTIGKLTFMFNLKNQQRDVSIEGFDGVGETQMNMSLGYKDGDFAAENQLPVFATDIAGKYAVKLRLKGALLLKGDAWIVDYAYAQLASAFHLYPPATQTEVFMCKGGSAFGTFDSARRTCTFDITYERYDLSFSQLYFNLFVNLSGQESEENIQLQIDKESYLEIYKQQEK